jgi:tellurium resistance protein TerZ
MAVSLKKGQKISLSKEGGAQLTRVAIGLGWGKRQVRSAGFFGFGAGTRLHDVDLDASCIVYTDNQQPVDAIYFGKLNSQDGSIQHTGDDRGGGGSDQDPNEVINVNLRSVPPQVKSIVFVVNSYSGETFNGIPFAFVNVVEIATNKEIARYNLNTEGGNAKGFIIAKVYRHNNDWKFHAIGEQCTGAQRTVADIEPFARNFS